MSGAGAEESSVHLETNDSDVDETTVTVPAAVGERTARSITADEHEWTHSQPLLRG